MEAGHLLSCLELLQFDNYNRPSIDSNIDFNISHSGNYVLCAISRAECIGIDIEFIKDIDINYYRDFMSNNEWHNITNSKAPNRRSYDYWTIKESIMKADGRGLSLPPQDIIIHADHALVYNKKWGLKKVPITDNQYCCHLASERH
ncbi:MAG: 4'-phosphopantetheinyl transferase family protein [Methylobacter sp.]